MSPTPEQIAALTARGWTWDADGRFFRMYAVAHADATGWEHRLFLTVRSTASDWIADYGWTGTSFGWAHSLDPVLAADECERWLVALLRQLPPSMLDTAREVRS